MNVERPIPYSNCRRSVNSTDGSSLAPNHENGCASLDSIVLGLGPSGHGSISLVPYFDVVEFRFNN